MGFTTQPTLTAKSITLQRGVTYSFGSLFTYEQPVISATGDDIQVVVAYTSNPGAGAGYTITGNLSPVEPVYLYTIVGSHEHYQHHNPVPFWSGALTVAPDAPSSISLSFGFSVIYYIDNNPDRGWVTPYGGGGGTFTVGGPSIKISDAPPVKIGSPDPLTAQFSVTLSAPATSIVSVNYTTKPGTALAGTDFTSKSGTITFQPGQTAATIQVPVTQQFITQDKAFTVELSNATSAGSAVTIDDSSGQALIDAPEYDLVFTFRQQQVGGVTKAGTITGQIFNHGELVTNLASMTGRASVDDAFPLKNLVFENVKGGAPAANQSRNFEKYPLTFDLKNFQPNPDQTAVIMHLGTFNNPKYTQFPSWASQSCLVVEQQFLDALQSNLSKLAGQTFTAKNVAAEVAWINRYVDVKFDVQTTLTQAKLSVDAPTIVNRVVSGGINPNATFEFDLSRSIEKDVLVLYSVTNEDTGATVVRTSLVSAFSTSSADISFSSLFGSAKPPKGAADALKIFSDAKGEIPLNKTTYNKSLPWNPADSYAIEIEAYAVSYQNGKEWYFDSRLSGMKGPADFSKQTLMFSNDLTAEFEFAQTPARSASMAALLEGDMFPFSDTSATPERASDIADLWLV